MNLPFNTDAALLVAAEWYTWVELEMSIHPDVTSLDALGKLVATLNVTRPHRCAEAVQCVVGLLDGFVVVAVAEKRDDWA